MTFLLYFTDYVPILFHFFIGNGGWSKLLRNVNWVKFSPYLFSPFTQIKLTMEEEVVFLH